MVSIPIWLMAAILALAGAKVATTPIGTGIGRGAKKTASAVYGTLAPKKKAKAAPPKPAEAPRWKCAEVETASPGTHTWVCIGPAEAEPDATEPNPKPLKVNHDDDENPETGTIHFGNARGSALQ